MKRYLRGFHRAFIQILFLERCRTCGKDINSIRSLDNGDIYCMCTDCWDDMTSTWLLEDEDSTCRIARDLTQSGDWDTAVESTELIVSSAIQYERQVKKLIRRYKFDDDRLLANDLSLLLFRAWRMLKVRLEAACDADSNSGSGLEPSGMASMIIVPVPLSASRLKQRGFNQSLMLAKLLSKYTKLEVRHKALQRIKHTKPQSGLAREQRIKNVESAFKAKAECVKDMHVVLIDDVCTSGATLVSCANELLYRGAKRVSAVTIARAILHAPIETSESAEPGFAEAIY